MPASRATTAWVVSGAIGLATFSAGMVLSQGGGETVPAGPQPAITVTPTTSGPTTSPPSRHPESPTATAPATETPSTGPSPVSPPSAETPD
jgi:hypothetical protein